MVPRWFPVFSKIFIFNQKMQVLDGSQVIPSVFGSFVLEMLLGITWTLNELFWFQIIKNNHFWPKIKFLGGSRCFRLLCIGDVIRHYMDFKLASPIFWK